MENQKFTFNCPHCGQPLEAETDWVGLECDCIYCGKPLIVPKPESAKGRLSSSADHAYLEDSHNPADAPKPPSRAPVITIMSRSNPISSYGQSQHQAEKINFWKRIPKWAYAVSCVAVFVIACLVSPDFWVGFFEATNANSGIKEDRPIKHSSSPTYSEKIAIGKVFLLYSRLQIAQQKLQQEMAMKGQSDGAMEFFTSLLQGAMVKAPFEDCPKDFAVAAKEFFRANAILQLCDAMKKLGPEAVKNALQNGNPAAVGALMDRKTWEDYAKLLEFSAKAEKDFELAKQRFGYVLNSYGGDNILEWSKMAYFDEEAREGK